MKRRRFLIGSASVAGGLATGVPLLATETVSSRDPTDTVKPVSELMDRRTRGAIQSGLAYLARRQITEGKHQGAFGTGGYSAGVAVTSLAGLAFLCSGSTPFSGTYASNIRACTDLVLRSVRPSGYISEIGATTKFSNMYGHGYAMLYLSQVAGMTKHPELKKKLESAIQLTCKIQNKFGGWRYQPVKRDSDLSITVCQIMALRAAHSAGFDVSNEVREKTIEYVDRCQNKNGSFHYTERGGRTTLALTAAGVVSYYSAGIYDDPRVEKALDWIFDHRPGRASGQIVSPMNYFYAHYYAIQAMWHAQLRNANYWNTWYPLIRDELIDRKRGLGGVWPEQRVGPEFATAMCCIILQIPLNYVPVFAP